MTVVDYPFTQEEMVRAWDEWQANCGPIALAFACRLKPDGVRHAIPDFDKKRYISPTMMRKALENLGRPFAPTYSLDPFLGDVCLTRVQWTGPWTKPGANPKWAYWHTHWVATWKDNTAKLVFDINGGIMTHDRWEREIVPLIVASIPLADGKYAWTHVWRLL
jgi:hypothetical protein